MKTEIKVLILVTITTLNIACKTTFVGVTDQNIGYSFKLPKSVILVDTLKVISDKDRDFVNYRNELFYKNIYLFKDSVMLGFDIFNVKDSEFLSDKEIFTRKATQLYLEKQYRVDVFTFDKKNNGYSFYHIHSMRKDDNKYQYVFFESEKVKPLLFRGIIRFPTNYSRNKVMRRCRTILVNISRGSQV